MKSANQDLLADMARLQFAMRRWFDRALTERGLSLARTKMLMLVQMEGGRLRAADIAERFGVAPRTVTEALDGLEREGLVQRVPDPSDRRAKQVHITPAGEAVIAVTEPLKNQLSEELLKVLGDTEKAQLHASIRKLLDNVTAA